MFVFLLGALGLATGCIGGVDDAMPEEDLSADGADPGETEEAAEKANQNETWTRTFHLTPTYGVAHGVPFQDVTVVAGGCDLTPDVHVPADATTKLVTRIEESSQNSTGEGAMTFLMHSPDDDWIYPPGTVEWFYRELPGTVEIVREQPVEGDWWIWVWPHGHVVDQTWDLTITIEGTGSGAEETGVFASDSPGSTECES